MPGSNANQPADKHIVNTGNRRPAPLPKPLPKPHRPGEAKDSHKPFGQNKKR